MLKRFRGNVAAYFSRNHGHQTLWQLIIKEPDWFLIVVIAGLLTDLGNFLKSLVTTFGGIIKLLLISWALYVAFNYYGGNSTPLSVSITILRFALQLAFGIAFAILQFVAIFWFMAKTKIEIITPDSPSKMVTFNDYKGQKELLKLVAQWVDLLKHPATFLKSGGTLVKGILLYGPPGTGKTWLAKAMAGEGKVAFISIEGSGFRAMFWGVDVLKMIDFCRKARNLAKRYGACIAYIDEIDAVGASRGGVAGDRGRPGMGGMMGMGMGSGSLTRLLTEMDGMDDNFTAVEKLRNKWLRRFNLPIPPRKWHVLFLGATNRPDALDPALTRNGRLDQKIVVEPADAAGRKEMIKYYLAKVKHDDSILLDAIVSDTPRATPAMIKSAITQDATRIAFSEGRDYITQLDVDRALIDQRMGIAHPIEEFGLTQRRQVAYHEAGHAVAFYHLVPEQRMVMASIVRRGGALGFVLPVDKEEVYALPLQRRVKEIMVAMAGQEATRIAMGEPWTGPGGDYEMVRARVFALVADGYWGVPVAEPEKMLEKYADQAKELVTSCTEEVNKLLAEHRGELEAVAERLLEKGTVFHDELVEIIEAAQTRPQLAEVVA